MTNVTLSGKCCPINTFDNGNPLVEKNTRWAIALTFVTMIAEIVGGWIFNSMALLADGWHMSSHTLALGLSAFAYAAARRYSQDNRFAFGTWKIEILSAYTSAIFLVGIAATMLFHSIDRLFSPVDIRYDEAATIACIGLLVNLICAWLLRDSPHGHEHGGNDHQHSHDHEKHSHDLNQRAAYIHVITDAATSVLAIVALFGGKFWGARWLDPLMGMVGAVLVAIWAYGLLRDAGRVLLDAEMDAPIVAKIRQTIAMFPAPAEIVDLHVWRVGRQKYACILSLRTLENIESDEIRRKLSVHEELAHVTIETSIKDK